MIKIEQPNTRPSRYIDVWRVSSQPLRSCRIRAAAGQGLAPKLTRKSWTRTGSPDRKQVKGVLKQGIGRVVGDTKLESEGQADKVGGKIQNAIGGLKDTLKGK